VRDAREPPLMIAAVSAASASFGWEGLRMIVRVADWLASGIEFLDVVMLHGHIRVAPVDERRSWVRRLVLPEILSRDLDSCTR